MVWFVLLLAEAESAWPHSALLGLRHGGCGFVWLHCGCGGISGELLLHCRGPKRGKRVGLREAEAGGELIHDHARVDPLLRKKAGHNVGEQQLLRLVCSGPGALVLCRR